MASLVALAGTAVVMLLAFGCVTSSSPAETDEVINVKGWKLSLLERGDACFVSYSRAETKGEWELAPTPPCRFVGNAESGPQTKRFGDGNERILLVVFGTPYLGRLPAKLATEGVYCGTSSQAVVVTPRSVYLSGRVAHGGLRCEETEIDEREFELFDQATRH